MWSRGKRHFGQSRKCSFIPYKLVAIINYLAVLHWIVDSHRWWWATHVAWQPLAPVTSTQTATHPQLYEAMCSQWVNLNWTSYWKPTTRSTLWATVTISSFFGCCDLATVCWTFLAQCRRNATFPQCPLQFSFSSPSSGKVFVTLRTKDN